MNAEGFGQKKRKTEKMNKNIKKCVNQRKKCQIRKIVIGEGKS